MLSASKGLRLRNPQVNQEATVRLSVATVKLSVAPSFSPRAPPGSQMPIMSPMLQPQHLGMPGPLSLLLGWLQTGGFHARSDGEVRPCGGCTLHEAPVL